MRRGEYRPRTSLPVGELPDKSIITKSWWENPTLISGLKRLNDICTPLKRILKIITFFFNNLYPTPAALGVRLFNTSLLCLYIFFLTNLKYIDL